MTNIVKGFTNFTPVNYKNIDSALKAAGAKKQSNGLYSADISTIEKAIKKSKSKDVKAALTDIEKLLQDPKTKKLVDTNNNGKLEFGAKGSETYKLAVGNDKNSKFVAVDLDDILRISDSVKTPPPQPPHHHHYDDDDNYDDYNNDDSDYNSYNNDNSGFDLSSIIGPLLSVFIGGANPLSLIFNLLLGGNSSSDNLFGSQQNTS